MQHLDLLLQARHPLEEKIRIFHAGAGACALPLCWSKIRPSASQIAADTDSDLLRTLQDWKVVPARSHLKLRAGDARSILEGSNSTYDVVVRDAFDGEATPDSLITTEWYQLVCTRLRPAGTYLANVAHGPARRSEGAPRFTSKQDVAAIYETFPAVAAIADRKVWRGERRGNITVAAWNEGEFEQEWLNRQVRKLPLPVAVYGRGDIRSWLGGATPKQDR